MKFYPRKTENGEIEPIDSTIARMQRDAKDKLQIVKDKDFYLSKTKRKKLKKERSIRLAKIAARRKQAKPYQKQKRD